MLLGCDKSNACFVPHHNVGWFDVVCWVALALFLDPISATLRTLSALLTYRIIFYVFTVQNELSVFARQLAMHAVASKPQFLSRDDVTETALEREREVHLKKAMDEGKPEAIAEKMVDGGLRKYYGEVVFFVTSLCLRSHS